MAFFYFNKIHNKNNQKLGEINTSELFFFVKEVKSEPNAKSKDPGCKGAP